jgi:hypothetical protein
MVYTTRADAAEFLIDMFPPVLSQVAPVLHQGLKALLAARRPYDTEARMEFVHPRFASSIRGPVSLRN